MTTLLVDRVPVLLAVCALHKAEVSVPEGFSAHITNRVARLDTRRQGLGTVGGLIVVKSHLELMEPAATVELRAAGGRCQEWWVVSSSSFGDPRKGGSHY